VPSHTNPAVAKFNHELWTKNVLIDATTEAHSLYLKLKEKGKMVKGRGGTEIKADPVRKTRLSVSAWNGVNKQNAIEPDIWDIPTHGWTGRILNLTLKDWDELANQGEEQINDHRQSILDAAKEDWQAALGGDVHVDGSALEIPLLTGLPGFVKATTTYGGLDQTQDFWKANLITGAQYTSNFVTNPYIYISNLGRLCQHGSSHDGKNRPDYVLFSRGVYGHVANYLETNFKRVIVQKPKYEYGHETMVIDGYEVDWDINLTADLFYMLNTNFMKWYYQSKVSMDSEDKRVLNPPGTLFQFRSKHQFVCTSPRHQGKCSTLGVSA